MMEHWLTILRDKRTKTAEFRRVSDLLARLLCVRALEELPFVKTTVRTPVGIAKGSAVNLDVMVVPILRSGLALLPAFQEAIPGVPVGFLGMERDEQTAVARIYYKKFPRKLPRYAVILDPMLATGCTACQGVGILREMGYSMSRIFFCGVVAAQDGFNALVELGLSTSNIVVAAIDKRLNDKKYIVPGLGDYGDRYFGTT